MPVRAGLAILGDRVTLEDVQRWTDDEVQDRVYKKTHDMTHKDPKSLDHIREKLLTALQRHRRTSVLRQMAEKWNPWAENDDASDFFSPGK